MNSYKTTVGLEVHAELKTKSKMFCGCENNPHAEEANVHVCPICMAHPGTLPTVNKEAVKFLMMVGRAIGGKLAEYSEFDRKNYFYPDIPKAYQISQYKYPFVVGGTVAGVEIRRVHLEEDTARSIHDQGEDSLVDFNRAGVPLMELVTEPVIHDSKKAVEFARELQLLYKTIGVSDANMDLGEMRVEANISVSNTDELGTLSEIKNLNSIKIMGLAIDFETKRQIEVLSKGGKLVQETRGWDESKGKTFSQRTKETADDYRYFPDPDIPKIKRSDIEEFSESRIDEILPELPTVKRDKYRNLGLTEEQISIIISDVDKDKFFKEVLSSASNNIPVKNLANYFTSDLLGIIETQKLSLSDAHSNKLAQIVSLTVTGELTSRVAKDLLYDVVFEGKDALLLAEEKGLLQNNSEDSIMKIVNQVVSENPSVVDEFKTGKETSLKFLVGQGMKLSKGAANPQMLMKLLKENIK